MSVPDLLAVEFDRHERQKRYSKLYAVCKRLNNFIFILTTKFKIRRYTCLLLGGRRTGMERSTTTRSERVLSSRLPPRTEDRSVPVAVP